MRSVMIGLVAVAVLLGGCSDEENTTKAAEESNTGAVVLDLSGSKTTDEVLAEKLKGLTKLKTLSLDSTKITDAGLVHLKGLTKLKGLDLWNTKITDAGLVHLKGLTKLKGLSQGKTKVTVDGIQELQEALPNCLIYGFKHNAEALSV